MLKHSLLLSLACIVLLEQCAASPAKIRRTRSFWPFETTTEPILTEKHLELLEKAGLGKNFNLSVHPMWKVHTYEGISLKPVHVETEIIEPNQLDARSVPAIPTGALAAEDAPITKKIGDDAANSTDLPDLSFLNDLGGFADYLPSPPEDEDFKNVDDIVVEEEEPGFFRRMWLNVWGLPKTSVKPIESADVTLEPEAKKPGYFSSLFSSEEQPQAEAEEDLITIYLPETQGPYVAVVVPAGQQSHVDPQSHQQPAMFASEAEVTSKPLGSLLLPAVHANQFGEAVVEQAAQAAAIPKPAETWKPVAKWPQAGGLGQSHSWVQSWSPEASYEVRVEQQPESDDVKPRVPIVETAQRKSSEDEATETAAIGQVQPEELPQPVVEQANHRPRDVLSNLDLPEGLVKKLQVSADDVNAALNSSESKARSRERLRFLQEDFEKTKQQLSYLYGRRQKQQQQQQAKDN